MFLINRKKSKKEPKIKAIPIIQIGVPNSVGNVYTEESVDRLFECFEKKNGNCYGELVHELKESSYVTDLSNVTHKVEALWVEDGFVVAVIKFLSNQRSNLAVEMLENGGAVLRPTIAGTIDPETREVKIKELLGVDFIPVYDWIITKEIKWIDVKNIFLNRD